MTPGGPGAYYGIQAPPPVPWVELSIEDLDTMSDVDLEEATHIVSTPEDRDRLLAETLAHAEVQDAQYKQPLPETVQIGLWKTPLGLVVFMLAAYIAVSPPSWLAGDPAPQLIDAELERGAAAALFIQAEQIRVFRTRTGRLPQTLDELPVRLPDIRYVRSNNRVFQLVAAGPNGEALVYDAARPDPRFEEFGTVLIQEPGS
jgi:hypothetical protein